MLILTRVACVFEPKSNNSKILQVSKLKETYIPVYSELP